MPPENPLTKAQRPRLVLKDGLGMGAVAGWTESMERLHALPAKR